MTHIFNTGIIVVIIYTKALVKNKNKQRIGLESVTSMSQMLKKIFQRLKLIPKIL